MNWDQIEGKWRQMKGSAKAKWGKLTDSDIDKINGRREQLVGLIQERYGVARELADKQVTEWSSSIDTVTAGERNVPQGASHETTIRDKKKAS